jgi:hypothetical protein
MPRQLTPQKETIDMGIWHHTDEKTGSRTEVQLTPEQDDTDARVVREFQALEGDVAKGTKIEGGDARVSIVAECVKKLPELRAAHWRKEVKRIGVSLPTPAPTPAPAAKPEATATK